MSYDRRKLLNEDGNSTEEGSAPEEPATPSKAKKVSLDSKLHSRSNT